MALHWYLMECEVPKSEQTIPTVNNESLPPQKMGSMSISLFYLLSITFCLRKVSSYLILLQAGCNEASVTHSNEQAWKVERDTSCAQISRLIEWVRVIVTLHDKPKWPDKRRHTVICDAHQGLIESAVMNRHPSKCQRAKLHFHAWLHCQWPRMAIPGHRRWSDAWKCSFAHWHFRWSCYSGGAVGL